MSHAQQIRDWLATQDGPRTVVEIAEAVGRPKDEITYQSVHRMWRDGFLTREGRCRQYRFALARDRQPRPRTPREVQLRRNAEAERKRRYRRGGMNAEQWQAECKRRTTARLARYAAEKAARAEAREKERAERLAERAAAREAARAARAAARLAVIAARARAAAKPAAPKPAPASRPVATPLVRQVIRLVDAPPKQAPPRFESVDEFLARRGRIERLDPGACSHPLKRIGWQPGQRKQAA